jgi:hypothetical protein
MTYRTLNKRSRLAGLLGALLATCLLAAALAPSALADFGIESFDGAVTSDAAGNPDTQAGSHPFAAGTTIKFNTENVTSPEGTTIVPQGNVKEITVELPTGLIGDPAATPKCSRADFAASSFLGSACPENTQVGTTTLFINGTGEIHAGVYNLATRPGTPATFGFLALFDPVIATATVRPGPEAGLDIHLENVSQGVPLTGSTLNFWGVPWSHDHDAERGSCQTAGGTCPLPEAEVEAARPFLTLPTSCDGPQVTSLHVTSWQGGEDSTSFLSHGLSGEPLGGEGCDQLPFDPSIATSLSQPSTDSPTGLSVDVRIPQRHDPNGLATAHLRSTAVTLPQGISIDPSAAGGLVGCSIGQFAQLSEAPSTCPTNSKIGKVEIDTPLFPEPLTGAIYLARQGENPFGSLIAIYVVAEGNGVRVKLPGKLSLDPRSGRVVTSFDETPQLPFEDFKLDFFDGPRAVLATGSTCGTQTVGAALTPWSGTAPVVTSATVTVNSGPGGSACPAGAGGRRFDLGFTAGTTSNAAGTSSAFDLLVTRPDGAQELSRIQTTLPKGLLAKLAGVPQCSDAAAAAGTCGADSQIGSVTVGAGAGSNPYYVKGGRAYLTGPYGGAPLGLDIVVPAIAGPLDLGTVNVRAAVFVDPTTSQVTVKSDPLPTILEGIPLRLRSVDVNVGRPGFFVNPTSCNPTQVDGLITSTEGLTASPATWFQAAGCGALGFSPKLTPTLLGGRAALQRRRHPALQVSVRELAGQANLKKVSLALPHSILLDQGHIKTVCTRAQFDARACPAASVYGFAKATTPLLAKPLEGPVYLRSSDHKLPDLVADLDGQIRIVLAGRIDSQKGGIRTTFTNIPDAPITAFTLRMQGGKKGLLVNSTNLCAAPNRALVQTTGQNGKTHDFEPSLSTSCGSKK